MFGRQTFDDEFFNRFNDRRSDYKPPPVIQINNPPFRTYKTLEGFEYPSMTSVLGCGDKSWLEEWKKRVGTEAAALTSFQARVRGSSLHGLAEHYMLGDHEKFVQMWRKAMPPAQNNFLMIKKALDGRLTDIYGIECALYTKILRMAGTSDLIGMYDGKVSIIDFKTSAKKKKREWVDSYFVQCDGYGQMWNELFQLKIEQDVIIIVEDHETSPNVMLEPFGDNLGELKRLRLECYKRYNI